MFALYRADKLYQLFPGFVVFLKEASLHDTYMERGVLQDQLYGFWVEVDGTFDVLGEEESDYDIEEDEFESWFERFKVWMPEANEALHTKNWTETGVLWVF